MVVMQLCDKDKNHLAFIACHHEQQFSLYDSDNDHEQSHFLEEISNFEAEILDAYFQIDKDLEKSFGGWTGELIITGENSEIIHHERPVSEEKNNSNYVPKYQTITQFCAACE